MARVDWLSDSRELFTVVSTCQFDVLRQRLLGPAITGERRFHVVQDWLEVRSAQDSVPQKLGKVVLLLFHAESEFEMLGIDPSNTQIGHITHSADGERHIETRHRRTARRALK